MSGQADELTILRRRRRPGAWTWWRLGAVAATQLGMVAMMLGPWPFRIIPIVALPILILGTILLATKLARRVTERDDPRGTSKLAVIIVAFFTAAALVGVACTWLGVRAAEEHRLLREARIGGRAEILRLDMATADILAGSSIADWARRGRRSRTWSMSRMQRGWRCAAARRSTSSSCPAAPS